ALPYLEAALERWPRDDAALLAKAFVLGQQGRHQAALESVEQVLARSPDDEAALEAAADYARECGQLDRALECARRAVAVNPWLPRHRATLAALLALRDDHDGAIAECERTLRFNPASVQMRSLLVNGYLKTGQNGRARTEFDVLLKLNPPNKEELRRWFEEQSR